MLFSTSVPLDALMRFCRLARHGLAAGLSVVDVFRQQAQRGPIPLRPIIDRITDHLERGDSLEDALKAEGDRLPRLFTSMAVVGEQTGHLPEAFGELERYFELQWKLRKQFIADITWPIIEFTGAVCVITLLLLVLGLIAPAGTQPLDPFGLGTGPRGAATFLLLVFGVLATLWGGYRLLTRALKQKPAVDRFLLRIPAIGPCLESLALARFCLAARLTLGAGLAVKPALRRSLEATGNAAYPARLEEALGLLRRGDDLTTVLRACRVFPQDFLDIVANAEEGGRVPEVMQHQAEYYAEESSRRMTTLAKVAGFLVWLFVAVVLIWCIFRIYAQTYGAALNQALQGF
jgi:type IV pilus assembly protein PilC